MESIPTYAETKYQVDNGFNVDLPRRNNSTTNMSIDLVHHQHVMPCYAQVNKTRAGTFVATGMSVADKEEVPIADPLYSEIRDSSTGAPNIVKNNAHFEDPINSPEQKKIGCDGTVYESVSRERIRSNPVKKQLDRQSLYADVDHTMKPPAPPPRNYEMGQLNI